MLIGEWDLSLCPMEAIFVKSEKIAEMNKFTLFPIKEGKFVCFVMLNLPNHHVFGPVVKPFMNMGALRWFHNV
jgi:hypothetical protein